MQVLQYNEDVRRDVLESVERLAKQGVHNDGELFEIKDMWDGQGIRSHTCFGDTPPEGSGVRLAIGIYGDGVSLNNPIGVLVFRNSAKVVLFTGS